MIFLKQFFSIFSANISIIGFLKIISISQQYYFFYSLIIAIISIVFLCITYVSEKNTLDPKKEMLLNLAKPFTISALLCLLDYNANILRKIFLVHFAIQVTIVSLSLYFISVLYYLIMTKIESLFR